MGSAASGVVRGMIGLMALCIGSGAPAALAQSALANGDVVGELSPGDELMNDDSYRDCHVLRVQPGDLVILQLRSSRFDPYLMVVLGAPCGSQSVLYGNDDLDTGRTEAGLHFRATVPVYSVVANSVGPGETGPYVLSARVIPAHDIREDIPVRDASGTILPPSRSEPEVLINTLYVADIPFSTDSAESLRAWFTPMIAERLMLLDQATDGMGLGFDFLVDGQDSDLSDLRIELRAGEDPDEPVVRARFMNFDTLVILEFVMTESRDGWRINDIRSIGPDGRSKWTLMGQLEEAIFEIQNAR